MSELQCDHYSAYSFYCRRCGQSTVKGNGRYGPGTIHEGKLIELRCPQKPFYSGKHYAEHYVTHSTPMKEETHERKEV